MGASKNGTKYREQLLASPVGDWKLREKGVEDLPENVLGVLSGHFAVFNRWTHIDNWMEGEFMERLAPGAFTKTFQENKGIRCLFNHGKDPSIGMKALGEIRSLDQDDDGAAYDVNFFDTSYNRDLAPGLRTGQYGASFRFQVIKEEIDDRPKISDFNPRGIPERTIQELRCMEFGPVTFPAYADASAGLRSLDYFEFSDFASASHADPEALARYLAFYCDDEVLKQAKKLRSTVRKSVSRTRASDDDNGGTPTEEPSPESSSEAAPSPTKPADESEQSEAHRDKVSLYNGDDPLDLDQATLESSAARSLITSDSQEVEPWAL